MKPQDLKRRSSKSYLPMLFLLLVPIGLEVGILNQAVYHFGFSKVVAFIIFALTLTLYFAYGTWCYIQSKKE
jgi:hypothetical protein